MIETALYIDHEMIMLIAQSARTDTGLPKVDEFIEELIWQTHASWVLSIINSSLEREFFLATVVSYFNRRRTKNQNTILSIHLVMLSFILCTIF